MSGDGSSAGSSRSIRSALSKTVQLDEVTAGNVLDHLRAYLALLAEHAPTIGITVLDTMKDVEDDIGWLADYLTIARFEFPRAPGRPAAWKCGDCGEPVLVVSNLAASMRAHAQMCPRRGPCPRGTGRLCNHQAHESGGSDGSR